LKNKAIHIIYVVSALLLLASCKPQVPSQYIQPDDMEDLIYDYHIAQGVAAQQDGNSDYNRRLAFELVLKEHGITQADFDSSLVYYYTRADRFQEIYRNVQSRLNAEAEKYGAVVNEVQNMVSNSTSGDTVDVWTGNRSLMLLNDRPYHLYTFSQQADTTFHEGDSFMMSFNTTWLMQNGNRQAVAYLAVTYANDSTTKAFSTISTTGTSTLRIPYCKERVKEIKGFVMCGNRPSTDKVSNLCVMFVNNITLAKFHNKIAAQPEVPQPLQIDSARFIKPDTAKYDSVRRAIPHPGDRALTVGEINRMRQMQQKPVMQQKPMMQKPEKLPMHRIKESNKPNN